MLYFHFLCIVIIISQLQEEFFSLPSSPVKLTIQDISSFKRDTPIRALQPATKVLFLDTSQFGVQSHESSTSTSICNVLESRIVAKLCRSLVTAGKFTVFW